MPRKTPGSRAIPITSPRSRARRRIWRRTPASRTTWSRTANTRDRSRAAWRCSASWLRKMARRSPSLSRLIPARRRRMRRDRATDRAVIARIAALSLLLGAGIALGGEPKEWLERMNKALTSRNYVGVFTHMRGDRAETLRIIHRVKGKDVSERLLSLDGSEREFIREGDELTCYFPDRREVLVERGSADALLALPSLDEGNSNVYEIQGGERERLLARKTRM